MPNPPSKPQATRKYDRLNAQYGHPPTAAEAARFRIALDTGAFTNADHTDAFPKAKTSFQQGPSAPAASTVKEREALIGAALQKKLALSTKIAQSYAEHARDGGGTMEALFGLGRYVQFLTKAKFIPGPPKGWDGVIRKTMDFQSTHTPGKLVADRARGYEGNYSSMKDEIRMTLVCENEAMYDNVRTVVLAMVGVGGIKKIKDSKVDAKIDACGYSGTNIVLGMPNGEPGEIQINIPTLMFGKMTPKEYRAQLGTGDAEYEKLRQYYGLPGGYGHALYEIYRVDTGGSRGTAAAEHSKRYYDLLRRAPNAPKAECDALMADINQFRQAHAVVEALFQHAGLYAEISAIEMERMTGRGRAQAATERATRNRGQGVTQAPSTVRPRR